MKKKLIEVALPLEAINMKPAKRSFLRKDVDQQLQSQDPVAQRNSLENANS